MWSGVRAGGCKGEGRREDERECEGRKEGGNASGVGQGVGWEEECVSGVGKWWCLSIAPL